MPNAKREIEHDHKTGAGRRSEMTKARIHRRYPIGAELIGEGQTHFRVWAPKAKRLEVVLEGELGNSRGAKAPAIFQELEQEATGYFSGVISAGAGTLYRFRVDAAENYHPDPA